jgi:hypothetical protein
MLPVFENMQQFNKPAAAGKKAEHLTDLITRLTDKKRQEMCHHILSILAET